MRTLREILESMKADPLSITDEERKIADRFLRKTPQAKARRYEAHKLAMKERNADMSRTGRDIGEIPPVADPARKTVANQDFRRFCETYFPLTFSLAWSPDHLKAIARIEQSVLRGGLFALAMPRGSGKSSLAEVACLWAMLYGHRQFVALIGSDEGHAAEMLDSLRTEIEGNEALLADFPETCFPVRALDGIPHRCGGQLYRGERTHISWTTDEMVLPMIPESRAAGVVVRVAGLTGGIRGMKFKRHDGKTVRPSLVIIDDPQTDASARSLSQCVTREKILAGAVQGLAGPGQKISGIMPCTVIAPGDVADHLLDRDKHPDWNGERTKMVYAFPSDIDGWKRYQEVRGESLRRWGDIRDATAYYMAHRADLDVGCLIAWPERFNHDEASAVQHAMNLRYQDEAAFFAEYQNEPLPAKEGELDNLLDADQIAGQLNGHDEGKVPIGCNRITAFVDVMEKLLFWCVCAWEDDFTGYVVDYGTWPDQRRRYFTMRDARATMIAAFPTAGVEGRIRSGLDMLTGKLLSREWRRDDGAVMRISRCLVDAGDNTDVVYAFCRSSAHAAVITPSHGKFVGARSRPFSEYAKKPGDRVGLNWRIPRIVRREVRHVLFDSNFWKSFLHNRLAVAVGDKGCLSLYGRQPEEHRLLADHLTAEFRTKTEGRGRVVDEWAKRPNGGDNHWFDSVVGCAVAASIEGAALPGAGGGSAVRKKRVSWAEQQRAARAARRR